MSGRIQLGDFYDMVTDRGHMSSVEEAEGAVEATLAMLRRVLPKDTVRNLAAQLPAELAGQMETESAEPDGLLGEEVFMGPLMSRLDTEADLDQTLGGLDLVSVSSADDAAREIRAVIEAIRDTVDPITATRVEDALPPKIMR
ncbi:MAG: DUF2267 domain-containing protein [Firmicutes bacterium]|nr:DUF2267 domain-containing protein [Bacillota bacterium]